MKERTSSYQNSPSCRYRTNDSVDIEKDGRREIDRSIETDEHSGVLPPPQQIVLLVIIGHIGTVAVSIINNTSMPESLFVSIGVMALALSANRIVAILISG